ncbi:MAG: 3-oxoacyl-[acyl-carrier-protein] reductase [Chloroflexi bacterium]|nr:3-oxoacyl-[acyl-carrier-protein] reductase [Chloroflexota bacterium]
MTQPAKPLQGKTALVTGASRGIGRAIALRLARDGAKVGVNYRANREAAESAAQAVREAGSEALLLPADVADAAQVQAMFQEIERAWGGVDILVNNAGVNRDGLIIRMSEEDWDAVLDTNLKGAFLCAKAAARSMLRKRWGRIINMSSVIGVAGNAGQANYAASKAGLIGLTRALAKELASRNITVNALTPGFIDTDMVSVMSEEARAAVKTRIALDRFGTADDVAALVAFLAGPEAAYITGQAIGVDGGIAI